jgi:eukaryotic-like serine/threonine-protein kinase
MASPSDSAARWGRVEQIFHEALAVPMEARAAFVRAATGSDAELAREVETLLAEHAAGGSVLERPALEQAGLLCGLRPGDSLGPYRIAERLGAGGMGEVFHARDERLGRDVALKTVAPAAARDRAYLNRLRREARILASLNHPHIATLYGVEESAGTFALVMEFVEGQSLALRLAKGRLTIGEAVGIAVQMADALAIAHGKGIVHRDLKPGNVMLSRGGAAKVLDFGLAKVATPAADAPTAAVALTEAGAVLGTAGYMAPEQVEGGEVDARADIFAFGAVLYEMLTGRKAFGGTTAARTLTAVLHAEPEPLDALAPGAPRELSRLVRLCMRKDQERRLQSIADAKLALEEIREELGHAATATPPRTATRRAWMAGALGASAVAGWYAGAWKRGHDLPAIIVTPLAVPPGQIYEPAISPDGRMVAFAATPEGETTSHIYLKLLGGGEPLRLTRDGAPDHGPVWSSDGRTIAFSRFTDADGDTESMFTIPALGGPERLIAPGAVLDWSPDGAVLLVLSRARGEASEYRLIAPEDGSARRLFTALPDDTPRAAHFSPDGSLVYFVESTPRSRFFMFAVPTGGGAPKPVPITGTQGIGSGPFLRNAAIRSFGFLRGGDIVFFDRSGQSHIPRLYRVPASGGKAVALPFGTDGTYVATSRSSPAIMYVENLVNFNLWRVAAWPGSDREPRQWIGSERSSQTPVVSPAGERIAYSSDRAGKWQIWSSDADGRTGFPVTPSPSDAADMIGSPSWSPDGSRIAYDVHIGGHSNIWVAPASGGIARQLTDDNTGNIVPAWSPDGLWVYFTCSSSGGVQTVWRVPAEGGPKQQITRAGGYSVKIAPDGQHIYYLKNSREGGLWRAPAEGGAEEPLLTECRTRNFWVLPEGIYMLDTGGNELAAMRRGRALFYRFATRKMEDLGFQTEKPVSPYGIGMSPDGKWLYYAQLDHNTSSLMNVENFQ